MDTVRPPGEPGNPSDRLFSVRRQDGATVVAARIPFTPSFRWHLHPSGTFWGLLAGEYKLFELNLAGDTLRTVTREFEPYPVTEEDLEAAIADLDWFVRQGGKIDRGRIPSSKPPTEDFFFDDEGNIWVLRVTNLDDEGRVVDIFDSTGRYLGKMRLPFRLIQPYPVIRGSSIWALTTDELEVPYVVRARLVKPSEPG